MTTRPARAPLLLALVWLAGAAVATSVGVVAVGQVASEVGDPAVPALSTQAVAKASLPPGASTQPSSGSAAPLLPSALAAPSRGSTPSATTGSEPLAVPTLAPPPVVVQPPAPAVSTTSGTFRSVGGTVGMQCVGTTARLLYATPADGYALDEQQASGNELEVRFEAGETKVRLKLSCSTGTPRLVEERVDTESSTDTEDD